MTEVPTRPVAGGEGPSSEAICAGIAAALCAQWSRCGCDDGSGAIDIDACTERIDAACAAYVRHQDVLAAIERGAVVWSGTEAQSFLDALEAASAECEPIDLDLSGVAIGTVPDGAPCTDISGAFTECTSGSSCQTSPFASPPAARACALDGLVTQRFQSEGQRCHAALPCGLGLRCAPRCGGGLVEGTCVVAIGVDGACRFDHECASGFCELESTEDAHTIERGLCAEPATRADGEPCTSSRTCASGRCDFGTWFVPSGAIPLGTCAPLLADGEDCALGVECASSHCSGFREVALDRCAETGAPCDASSDGCSCVPTTTLGTCGDGVPEGGACRGDTGECATGECDSTTRTCRTRPRGAIGWPCAIAADCEIGGCVRGACARVDRPDGSVCGDPLECASRTCVGGACAPAVCAARIDPTGHGAFWLSPPLLTPR